MTTRSKRQMSRPQRGTSKDTSDDESLLDASLIHTEASPTSFVVKGSIAPKIVSPSKTDEVNNPTAPDGTNENKANDSVDKSKPNDQDDETKGDGLSMPGRITAVHCMDVPTGNSGKDTLRDFPGDIIRLHEKKGWHYIARYSIWKEPLAVRNRTMQKNLAHKTIVDDSSRCSVASADYLLVFRRQGENQVPIAHPTGLDSYAGERIMPAELLQYRNWEGKQTENRFSHWIWRQYASAFWDDIRIGRVLPFKEAREEDDEKHVHPLQLDVIERVLTLWSNPGEVVLTPFMGIGSETYVSVQMGRLGVGIELKPSYYRQSEQNIEMAVSSGVHQSDNLELALA